MSASAQDRPPILELRGVGKSFRGTVALRDIHLAVHPGEVVGLVGDNGAGKSTLIKILAGVHRPDSGSLLIDGVAVDLSRYGVAQARSMGIETLFQESTLGEQQPLWRNIFVGRALVNRWGMLRVAEEKRVTMEILRRYVGLQGRAITADTPVQTLSGGERQGVAIGRAMYFDARLVILDEPTTALSLGEVDRVLTFIEQLSAQGRACILISHNVGHIYRVASRFFILDRGEMVASCDRQDISLADLHGRLLQIHAGGH